MPAILEFMHCMSIAASGPEKNDLLCYVKYSQSNAEITGIAEIYCKAETS